MSVGIPAWTATHSLLISDSPRPLYDVYDHSRAEEVHRAFLSVPEIAVAVEEVVLSFLPSCAEMLATEEASSSSCDVYDHSRAKEVHRAFLSVPEIAVIEEVILSFLPSCAEMVKGASSSLMEESRESRVYNALIIAPTYHLSEDLRLLETHATLSRLRSKQHGIMTTDLIVLIASYQRNVFMSQYEDVRGDIVPHRYQAIRTKRQEATQMGHMHSGEGELAVMYRENGQDEAVIQSLDRRAPPQVFAVENMSAGFKSEIKNLSITRQGSAVYFTYSTGMRKQRKDYCEVGTIAGGKIVSSGPPLEIDRSTCSVFSGPTSRVYFDRCLGGLVLFGDDFYAEKTQGKGVPLSAHYDGKVLVQVDKTHTFSYLDREGAAVDCLPWPDSADRNQIMQTRWLALGAFVAVYKTGHIYLYSENPKDKTNLTIRHVASLPGADDRHTTTYNPLRIHCAAITPSHVWVAASQRMSDDNIKIHSYSFPSFEYEGSISLGNIAQLSICANENGTVATLQSHIFRMSVRIFDESSRREMARIYLKNVSSNTETCCHTYTAEKMHLGERYLAFSTDLESLVLVRVSSETTSTATAASGTASSAGTK